MVRSFRVGAGVVALAILAAGIAFGASPAAASPISGGSAVVPQPAGRGAAPAIDPAFPSHWRRWTFTGQNPGNRDRWAMDAQYSGGDGAQVWLWGQNGGDAQIWVEEPAGEGGSFLHPGYNRWLCLGRNTTGWGSYLLVKNCHGVNPDDQRFNIRWDGDSYEIRSIPEGLCVDVQYSSWNWGTPLWLWGCHGGESQRWLQPAPARNDGRSETVYFVPGYSTTHRHDCAGGYWSPAMNAMRSWGWTGTQRTVSFFAGDTNCNTSIYHGYTYTSIGDIGRQLAWEIYNRYSKYGWSVDIMGHSMGGLIARAAVNGTRLGTAEGDHSWPPFIYVEDVATLSTPHDGAELAGYCDRIFVDPLCMDMRHASPFLNWLSESGNPQSSQGTDWTVIGADDDEQVEVASALGMAGAGHKVWYHAGQIYRHNNIHKTTSGTYAQEYWNYHDGWHYLSNGAASILSAATALHYWWFL